MYLGKKVRLRVNQLRWHNSDLKSGETVKICVSKAKVALQIRRECVVTHFNRDKIDGR